MSDALLATIPNLRDFGAPVPRNGKFTEKMINLFSDPLRVVAMFTRPLLAILMVACSISYTVAESKIGGRLSGQVSLQRSGSPFTVTSNLEIPAGSQLTIQSGVVIRLVGHSITVAGKLIAKGTEESPIRFTSAKEQPAPGDWGTITFQGAGSGATFDEGYGYVSGSILEWVTVDYGAGLVFDQAAPAVVHCRIEHNRKERGGGIYAIRCNPIVRESTIAFNIADKEGGGIRTIYCHPVLMGNSITHNAARYGGGGVSTDHSAATISGNEISFNFAARGAGVATGDTQVGQTSMSGRSHSKPTLYRNKICNNTAVYAGGGISVEGSPTITGNIIIGNRVLHSAYHRAPGNNVENRKTGYGAGIKVTETYGGPLRIEKNLIAGNRGAYWGGGIACDRASGIIRNNRCIANRAVLEGSGISIMVRAPGRSASRLESDWLIRGNEFSGYQNGILEFARPDYNGVQSIRIESCSFFENEGIALNNLSKNDINASQNYWGVESDDAIAEVILDYYDHQARGRVHLQPRDALGENAELPKVGSEQCAFLANCPESVRAGQGFNRVPGTPPSVTMTWTPGKLENVAGYVVHLSRIVPRFDRLDPSDDLRVAARCNEGFAAIDVGNVNRTIVTGLKIGDTYEVSITGYDFDGLESSKSDPFVVKVER